MISGTSVRMSVEALKRTKRRTRATIYDIIGAIVFIVVMRMCARKRFIAYSYRRAVWRVALHMARRY